MFMVVEEEKLTCPEALIANAPEVRERLLRRAVLLLDLAESVGEVDDELTVSLPLMLQKFFSQGRMRSSIQRGEGGEVQKEEKEMGSLVFLT